MIYYVILNYKWLKMCSIFNFSRERHKTLKRRQNLDNGSTLNNRLLWPFRNKYLSRVSFLGLKLMLESEIFL